MVGALRAGALVVLAACLNPIDALHCGDTTCPAATDVCVDQTACVDTGALDACTGVAPQSMCEFPMGTPGWCIQHDVGLVCDPSTCGDGIIDPRTKEQCDGSATFDLQCADLGFDIGRPSCANDRCALETSPELSACRSFDWTVIVERVVTAMWSNGNVLAYVDSAGLHMQPAPGVATTPYPPDIAGTFALIAGRGDRMVVVGTDGTSDQPDLFDVTPAGLVSLQFSKAASGDGIASVAVGDGIVYAITACSSANVAPVTLWQYTGTWQAMLTAPCSSTGAKLAISSTGMVYLADGASVYELPPGTKTLPSPCLTFTGGTVFDLAVRSLAGREAVFAVGPSQLSGGSVVRIPFGQCPGAELFSTLAGNYHLAFTDASLFVVDALTGHALRWDGKTGDLFRAPASQIADDGIGHVYSYSGSIKLYPGITFSEIEPFTLELGERVITGVEVGEPMFATDRKILQLPTSVTWNESPWQSTVPMPNIGPIRAFWGATLLEYVVATYPDPGDTGTPGVWFQAQNASTVQKIPAPPSGDARVDGLWMIGSASTVYAVGTRGTDAFLAKFVRGSPPTPITGTWFEDPKPGCEAHGISVFQTDVVAVGGCQGQAKVWRLTGNQWAEQQTPPFAGPLYGVKVFANGDVFAVGDGGAMWSIGGTWHTDPTVIGRFVSGTSSNDVWTSGTLSSIQHWDGQPWAVTGQPTWSRVTTDPLTDVVVIAQPNRVVIAGGAADHVSLLREPVP